MFLATQGRLFGLRGGNAFLLDFILLERTPFRLLLYLMRLCEK